MARLQECGSKLWPAQPGHGSRDPVFVSWHVTLDEQLIALPDMQKESESPSFIRPRDAPIVIYYVQFPICLQANGPIQVTDFFVFKQMHWLFICSITGQTVL